MSGAEIFAAVGTAASFLQLIDFGTKVCTRLAKFSIEAKEVPKAFQYVSIQLPLVRCFTKNKGSGRDRSCRRTHLEALLPVIKDCQTQIEMFDEIFDEEMP